MSNRQIERGSRGPWFVSRLRGLRLALAAMLAVAAVLSFDLAASSQGSGGAGESPEIELIDGREAARGRILVKFRGDTDTGAAAPSTPLEVQQLLDADLNVEVGGTGARLIHSRTLDTKSMLAALAGREDVVYAEPDYVAYGAGVPNDSFYGQTYGMRKIGAEQAWDTTTGTDTVVVAVADSGLDLTHPDLAANVWSAPEAFSVAIGGQQIQCPAGSRGFNAINNTCNPQDDHNHGTHVSGIIGAVGNNATGVAGVNWRTKLLPVKWLNSNNSGFLSDAIDAIEFTVQTRQRFMPTGGANVRVINNSWWMGGPSQAVLDQIRRAEGNGMFFVAIAGNGTNNSFVGHDNDTTPTYPGSYGSDPGVITVAATDSGDNLTSFSNWGQRSVHLGAPGASILSTIVGGAYSPFSGTSMAAPHVSGSAALLLSRCSLSAAGLKGVLLTNTDALPSLTNKTTSGGRLNVNSALAACTPVSNIIEETRFFVRQQYVDFLGREPDPEGFGFWVNSIGTCGADADCRARKRIDTSAAFFLSIEFQGTGYVAYRAHQAAFDAGPGLIMSRFSADSQVLGRNLVVSQPGWELQLEANKTAYFDEFVQRAEFNARYPTSSSPAQFVDALNANAGGSLSTAERDAAINEFGGAGTIVNAAARARALRRVVEDTDFNTREKSRAFVYMQYIGYLRRNPNSFPDNSFEGYNFWLTKLNNHGGDYVAAEMVKSFLISVEYFVRFSS